MFPSLDFSRFREPSSSEEFCREFVSALKEYGFVKLINHGIPSTQIDQAFTATRRFFQLPLEQKLKSPHPPTVHPHRGFSPVGLENIGAVSNYGSAAESPYLKDMKESYDIGSEYDPLYKNIWPPSGVDDAFQPIFTSFFEAGYRTELTILKALSIGLGLPEQTLGQLHAEQTNELRMTHYPRVTRGDFAHSTRIATHTDFGTITLLFQDAVGGLRGFSSSFPLDDVIALMQGVEMEVPPHSGQFMDIESGGPSECILNVGDCLEKWTGLHSARHRVHLPEWSGEEQVEEIIPERFSIAYFAKPDRAANLRPLSGEADPEAKHLTANEFQHMRIAGTY